MKYVHLNNNIKMPILGYSACQPNPRECERCVLDAINAGYRMIDTAQVYENEEAVGKAIHRCDLSRDELFLAVKICGSNTGYERAKASIEKSLEKLQTGYIDLLLLHQPFGDHYGAYRAMEEAYKEGWIRAIGIANFSLDQMEDLCNFAEIVPAVHYLEAPAFWQQGTAPAYMDRYQVQQEVLEPFTAWPQNILHDPVLLEIGKKNQMSPRQVALHCLFQSGIVALSQAGQKEDMVETMAALDFVLDDTDMEALIARYRQESVYLPRYEPVHT